ncbi:MAG: AbrB/MazE/SpoVT family DNA-binding domain-containing protein [Phycisphaerae bacterium]
MTLIKTIRKVGNGSALPLDNTLLELTGLHIGDQVQITIDGPRIILTPAKVGIGKEKIEKSLAKFRIRYARALAELAK